MGPGEQRLLFGQEGLLRKWRSGRWLTARVVGVQEMAGARARSLRGKWAWWLWVFSQPFGEAIWLQVRSLDSWGTVLWAGSGSVLTLESQGLLSKGEQKGGLRLCGTQRAGLLPRVFPVPSESHVRL